MDVRLNIIEQLEKLRKKEVADKEVWKARAYTKVIRALSERSDPITSIDDVDDIPGIGTKIKAKIQEIIETGHLKQANVYNADDTYKIANELMGIHGIGPAKAAELVKKHGIRRIQDLEVRQDLLNDVQKLGLKYHVDFMARIPRREMLRHEAYIKDVVASIEPRLKVEVVGSFRRGAADSGDIDVLITGNDAVIDGNPDLLKQITAAMQNGKYIVDTLALGAKKCLAVSKVKYGRRFRRLDLLITRKHEFPFALLYFTGSAEFNTRLRAFALASKKLSLNEYGLRDIQTNKFVEGAFETEKDVFDFLGIRYMEPKDRTPTADLCHIV